MSDELDRLITQWAARHAPDLIAQAQADALELARERLRARLVDALLEPRAPDGARPRPSAEQPAAAATDRPAATADTLLWAYGVVAARLRAPRRARALTATPSGCTAARDVTALVSRRSRRPVRRGGAEARGSRTSTRSSRSRAPTSRCCRPRWRAAPSCRSGCARSTRHPSGSDAMLDREASKLAATLDAARRDAGVGRQGVPAHPLPPCAAAEPAATGTEYLSRKRERREAVEAGREESETLVAGIHARLTEVAAAAVLSRPHDRRLSGREAEMVLNGAYLVPGDGADGFRAIVEALGRRHERGRRRARADRPVAAAPLRRDARAVSARREDIARQREVALVDLVDRLLAGGVVIGGDITLTIADVDLVYVGLRALITSVATADELGMSLPPARGTPFA